MWHSKYSKSSLSIRDKTEHQRRHLFSISNIKSRVDARQPWKKPYSSTQRRSISPFIRDKVNRENSLLASKIIDISQKETQREKLTNKFSSMSRSLSSVVVGNRNRGLRHIDQENVALFNRLVSAKPVYKTGQFRKFTSQNSKYRLNILKSKVHNVDYTQLAHKTQTAHINKFKLIRLSGRQAQTM